MIRVLVRIAKIIDDAVWEKPAEPGAKVRHIERTPAPSHFGDRGPIIRLNTGQVTAVGGQPVRTRAGNPIRHVDGDIIIDRPDGTQVIYCGREGRADFACEHGTADRPRIAA